ncbi:MAG TPA: hypothetical protein VEA99_05755 [Gemmatimonadaceae bacterium]|nr:hypothetical protein [Gemmatimonadaceae bacterium]
MTDTSTDADEQLSDLPARVLRLIDREVAVARAARVRKRVRNVEEDLVNRRRCAAIIAKYLLEEYDDGIQDVA